MRGFRQLRGPRGRCGWLLVAAAISCASGSSTGPPDVDADVRILFVGNSLTYVNDLPALVAAVSNAAGGPAVATAAVAFPDYSLEDHWNRGDALDAIGAGGWDWVVLQQGPSSLPESRDHLVEWAARFGERIRAAGATPVLYMVWPSADRVAFLGAVRDSYAAGAEAAGGALVPAGEAWRLAWDEDPDLALYSVDGFHPSLTGSVLAAFTFHDRLLGGLPSPPPIELPRSSGAPVRLRPELAALLARAAIGANEGLP